MEADWWIPGGTPVGTPYHIQGSCSKKGPQLTNGWTLGSKKDLPQTPLLFSLAGHHSKHGRYVLSLSSPVPADSQIEHHRVLLVPLPVMGRPFQRVTMDMIGFTQDSGRSLLHYIIYGLWNHLSSRYA